MVAGIVHLLGAMAHTSGTAPTRNRTSLPNILHAHTLTANRVSRRAGVTQNIRHCSFIPAPRTFTPAMKPNIQDDFTRGCLIRCQMLSIILVFLCPQTPVTSCSCVWHSLHQINPFISFILMNACTTHFCFSINTISITTCFLSKRGLHPSSLCTTL